MDEAVGVGNGEGVGIGRRHVDMGGEAREAGAILLHGADGGGGRELGAQAAEQIDIGDQEILNASFRGDFCKIGSHCVPHHDTEASAGRRRSNLIRLSESRANIN